MNGATDIEMKVFYYALNIFYRYGVSYKDRIENSEIEEPTPELFTLLDKLRNKIVTGNTAKVMVQNYADNNGSLILLILSRKLYCGVALTTVNKARPNYIPTFNVQLAKDVPLDKVSFPRLAQVKYDGVRIITVIRDHEVLFYTRNGNLINMPELRKLLTPHPDIVLDGEMILKPTNIAKRSRKQLSGMLNSARQNGFLNEHLITYKVFDVLTIDEWDSKCCTVSQILRNGRLTSVHSFIHNAAVHDENALQQISTVSCSPVHNASEAKDYYNVAIADGEEGLILKSSSGYYTFKRSGNWIKVKVTLSIDLICNAVIAGQGSITGLIGALGCSGYADDGTYISVNVGTGFTRAHRSVSKGHYIGKTIEIEYNEVIQNNAGQSSLFLPRFVCVRDDK